MPQDRREGKEGNVKKQDGLGFDFGALPGLSKTRILELAQGQWVLPKQRREKAARPNAQSNWGGRVPFSLVS